MCGILAAVRTDLTPQALEEALTLMTHRGPDYSGNWSNQEVWLGHLRLAILDLDPRSNQPFTLGKLRMVYNGEIYNYLELIKEHHLQVHTAGDTEVVLAMYQKYGKDCLKYFNGMFAFVIYDEETGDVFAARDRLGIKPLYFRNLQKGWLFSSEIAPLIQLKDSPIDAFAIRQYRKLRMTVREHTIYEDIKFFPAAHYFFNGTFHAYWDLDVSPKEPPTDEELQALIEDAVKIRRRADVPLGCYLSGGLDSTILSFLVKPEHVWTVGFPNLNEFEWSSLANEKLKSKLHQITVNKREFIQIGQWMVQKRKEPLSVPNEILLYLMTKVVKTKNTVILSGEGADELFWGYDRIFKWAHAQKEFDLRGFDEKYCYGSHRDDEVLDYALENIKGHTPLEKTAYYFQIVHLQGLLRRVDNSTMLCSVEARVPFVDHRLVERLAGTPFEWKMGNSFKEPLKRIFKNLLPKAIIERKKIGFPVPLESIFTNREQGTPMDAWLDFNLQALNIKTQTP